MKIINLREGLDEYRNVDGSLNKEGQKIFCERVNKYLEEKENYGTTIIKTDDIKIEKPDKIEKITISEDEKSLFFDDKYQDISLHNISPIEVAFAIKINEIIDKINGDDK